MDLINRLFVWVTGIVIVGLFIVTLWAAISQVMTAPY
jgi:hypothetical protein